MLFIIFFSFETAVCTNLVEWFHSLVKITPLLKATYTEHLYVAVVPQEFPFSATSFPGTQNYKAVFWFVILPRLQFLWPQCNGKGR